MPISKCTHPFLSACTDFADQAGISHQIGCCFSFCIHADLLLPAFYRSNDDDRSAIKVIQQVPD
jgi:hypothetical protein